VIIPTAQLASLVGQVTMVDGSFDPLHDGHIAYFKAAAQLGLPVLCNIAADDWTITKHPVLLSQAQRAEVIDAIRYIEYVHLSHSTTLEVLMMLQPKIYAKGNDWLERGGIPALEKNACDSSGITVQYLDTVLNSSSQLLRQWKLDDTQ
jgi:glycerol-3-phosphate cytidylyltransferase-like family protein